MFACDLMLVVGTTDSFMPVHIAHGVPTYTALKIKSLFSRL